jgi:DNA-directed RNA polymerase subunit RPC12/RpoP
LSEERGKVVRGLKGILDDVPNVVKIEFTCSGCGAEIVIEEDEGVTADHYSCDCGLTTLL